MVELDWRTRISPAGTSRVTGTADASAAKRDAARNFMISVLVLRSTGKDVKRRVNEEVLGRLSEYAVDWTDPRIPLQLNSDQQGIYAFPSFTSPTHDVDGCPKQVPARKTNLGTFLKLQ